MRVGVHPSVVGAEAGSVFPTGLALPRRQPGAEHTGSAWDASSVPPRWGGDGGGGGSPAPHLTGPPAALSPESSMEMQAEQFPSAGRKAGGRM